MMTEITTIQHKSLTRRLAALGKDKLIARLESAKDESLKMNKFRIAKNLNESISWVQQQDSTYDLSEDTPITRAVSRSRI